MCLVDSEMMMEPVDGESTDEELEDSSDDDSAPYRVLLGIDALIESAVPYYELTAPFDSFVQTIDVQSPALRLKLDEYQCSPAIIQMMYRLDSDFKHDLEMDKHLSDHLWYMQEEWHLCIGYLRSDDPRLYRHPSCTAFTRIERAMQNRIDLFGAMVTFCKLVSPHLDPQNVARLYAFLEKELSKIRKSHYMSSATLVTRMIQSPTWNLAKPCSVFSRENLNVRNTKFATVTSRSNLVGVEFLLK